MQVFVENLALAVGQFLEAGKGGIQRFFAAKLDAEFGQLGPEGIAAGELAQRQAVGAPAH